MASSPTLRGCQRFRTPCEPYQYFLQGYRRCIRWCHRSGFRSPHYIGAVLVAEDRVGAGWPVSSYIRGWLSFTRGHLCNAVDDVPLPQGLPAVQDVTGLVSLYIRTSFIRSHLYDAAVDDISLRQEAATGPERRVNRARSPPT